MSEHDTQLPDNSQSQQNFRTTLMLAGSTIALGILGLVIMMIAKLEIVSVLQINIRTIGAGIAATIPLLIFLVWLYKTRFAPIARLREDQLKFFADNNIPLDTGSIFAFSIAAGIGEELLFRGALQGVFDLFLPSAAAIIIAGVLFGALHCRSYAYAVIVSVAGVYFGWLYVATGSLIAPIIAHTLYDLAAFFLARAGVNELRATNAHSAS